MKLRHLFATLSLAVVAGAGVAAGLSSGNNAQPVKATNNHTVYVDFSSIGAGWEATSGTTSAHMFTEGQNNGYTVAMTSLGSNVYSFTFDSDSYDTFIVAKINGDDWVKESAHIAFYTGANTVKITGWNGEKGLNYNYDNYTIQLASSRNYVVDLRGAQEYWLADSSKTFLDSYFGSSHKAVEMSRIGNSYMFAGTLPASTYITGLIVVRGTTGFVQENGVDWSKAWNQTPDILMTNTNNSNNGIKLGTWVDDYEPHDRHYRAEGFEVLSNEFYSDGFSYYFLHETTPYCFAVEQEVLDQLGSDFTSVANSATASGFTDVKSTFYGSQVIRGKGKTYPSLSSEAISRYVDMRDLGYADFLGLGDNMPNHAVINTLPQEANQSSVIIALVGVVSLVAIGGFFFIRRKRA